MTVSTVYRPNYDGEIARVRVLHDAADERVESRAVVVNLGTTDAATGTRQQAPLPPMSSTIVTRGTVSGSLVLLIEPGTFEPGDDDLEARARRHGWQDFYGGDGPVLLRSSQDAVGTVQLDRGEVLRQDGLEHGRTPHLVRTNLWFSPSGTDCGIHNVHPFIEVHTQVVGHGRMQKFDSKDHQSLYEDQQLSPGVTNPVPFCADRDGELVYPWHQYRADTDCLWLAIEYHQV